MNRTLIVGLSIALLFGSPLLSAAPQPPAEAHQERGAQGGGKQQSRSESQGRSGQTPQKNTATNHAQQPPKDFSSVHQAFHERRAQIGRGPAIPAGVNIQKGKPLPQGYGKRLDAKALNGLPSYQGYEWRRVGSDIVLVAVTTGIVYTILQGVLN
ncbi:anti-virulence regulator CigR family protein [Pseudomonas lopnurensis]|uniref:anti-virulence regulator CigR family protein n=1 Tax=Pseudomonas lopnurensis TaxID=1477517 RepID=UPI001879D33D|nr:anti-virulence regulator CigR family protein [Pseudomonas lopnurensis]MBE7374164.1 RcnB family protein [Pseudomonas lopnurensis]